MRRLVTGLVIPLALVQAVTGARAEDQRGRGSIGASLGAMRWTGGIDLRQGAEVRPMGEAVFGYVWRSNIQFVSHVGFGWNGYNTCYQAEDGSSVCSGWSSLIPRGYSPDTERPAVSRVGYATAEIQQNFGIGKYQPHVNLGAGMYGWRAGSTRHVLKDPATQEHVSGISPGLNLGIGVENYVHPRVAIDAAVAGHYIFSANQTKLPSGFGQNAHYVQLRLGVRWYFGIGAGGALLPAGEEKP